MLLWRQEPQVFFCARMTENIISEQNVTFRGIKSLCKNFKSSWKEAGFSISCFPQNLLHNLTFNNQKPLVSILNIFGEISCPNNAKTSSPEKHRKKHTITTHNNYTNNSGEDQNTCTKEGPLLSVSHIVTLQVKENNIRPLPSFFQTAL